MGWVEVWEIVSKNCSLACRSYDCLAFIAGQAGDADLKQQAKIKDDKIFSEEKRLYEEAKSYLNRV